MPNEVDAYIASCDPEVQPILQKLRAVIHEVSPDITEKFSWQMPTFCLHGNLVHFFAHKHHIGFYPGAEGVEHFLPKLSAYHTSKGGIQLPLDKPIPYELVREITEYRVAQNIGWHEEKLSSKKKPEKA